MSNSILHHCHNSIPAIVRLKSYPGCVQSERMLQNIRATHNFLNILHRLILKNAFLQVLNEPFNQSTHLLLKIFPLKKLPKYFERYFHLKLKIHALKLLPLVFRVSAVSDGCCRVCCAVWSSGWVRVLWRPAVYVGVDEGVWMQERV